MRCHAASSTWRGRQVDPAAIRRTALLTVEGERDDICSLGQTLAAHDLCSGLRPYMKTHYVQAGVGHYGVFSGKRWSSSIYPVVRDVIHTCRSSNRVRLDFRSGHVRGAVADRGQSSLQQVRIKRARSNAVHEGHVTLIPVIPPLPGARSVHAQCQAEPFSSELIWHLGQTS